MAVASDNQFDREVSARAQAEERKIRAWFEKGAGDPDFVMNVKIVARDLAAAKTYSGGSAVADPHDVTLSMGQRKMRIPLTRWRPLIQRGYVENSTKPALTEDGDRILRLYNALLREAGSA